MRSEGSNGGYGCASIVDAENTEDSFEVLLDRSRRHLERAGELGVGATSSGQRKRHVGLARCETEISKMRSVTRLVAESPHQQHRWAKIARVNPTAPSFITDHHVVACCRGPAVCSGRN